MKIPRTFVVAAAVAAAGLVLAGCRSEEQGRPLTFNKGTYSGKKVTTSLSDARLNQLNNRIMLQSGGVSGPAQVARPTQDQTVTTPGDPALADRLQKQSGK